MTDAAILALADGTVFHGRSIGAPGRTVGEVVFNTAITGYQEILTDPSYHQQIVTLTYPHIGNVGVNAEDAESQQVFAAGLVIRDYPAVLYNWRAEQPLQAYLQEANVVAIADIDTRMLTRILRDRGAQNGCIMAGTVAPAEAIAAAQAFPGLKGADLARLVTTDKSYRFAEGSWDLRGGYRPPPAAQWRVVAYDFGVKRNILRLLVDRGCEVAVVPAQHAAEAVLAERPDGVFLSNGPGDPEPCDYAIDAIRTLLNAGVPLFGICLGHQLLGLAAGARTLKMKFGHHGANHPVQDLATGQVLITSQNHGFAIDDSTLPPELRATHRSLFDGTLQGIEHSQYPAFGFQGHPEASPGPHDVRGLFDRFIDLMAKHRVAA